MTREVLVDASMLISLYEGDQDNEVDRRRSEVLEALLSDPEVSLNITPLIYYEVMRDTSRLSPAEMDVELSAYIQREIRAEHGRRAAELFRQAKAKGKDEWLDKRRFDVFHCVCAELDELEFVHDNTKDIPKIQNMMKASRSTQDNA